MKISQAAFTPQHLDIVEKWKTKESSNWEYFDIADDKDWVATFWAPTSTSVDALADARERFANQPHVNICISPDGLSLSGVPDGVATAVFSYDAMVHFELMTVACYIMETARVLKPGGRGLFHHSNLSTNPTGRIDENPGWRNFMSKDIMNHFLSRANLRVIDQVSFDRENVIGDAITLFEKSI